MVAVVAIASTVSAIAVCVFTAKIMATGAEGLDLATLKSSFARSMVTVKMSHGICHGHDSRMISIKHMSHWTETFVKTRGIDVGPRMAPKRVYPVSKKNL